jgi:hypothetical protein
METTKEERSRWQALHNYPPARPQDAWAGRLGRDVHALLGALGEVEAAMDDANAHAGTEDGLCLFCPATEYSGQVGIVHKEGCVILKARAVLGE